MTNLRAAIVRAALLLVLATDAGAAVTTYASQAAFAAALAGLAPVAGSDFDGVAPLTVIPDGGELGGLTFHYTLGGESLLVIDGFSATSGANSLGVTGELVLLATDAFTVDFPPATAIGLYVIGEDLLPGDVEIQTAAGNAPTGAAERTLPDGSQAFFVGLVESEPDLAFGSASVVSFGAEVGDFVWNVDDLLAAPEPCGAGAIALLALAAFRRRREGDRPRARSAFRRDR